METWEIWISHQEKSMSFQPATGYNSVLFLDEHDMWTYIYRFLKTGYRIQ